MYILPEKTNRYQEPSKWIFNRFVDILDDDPQEHKIISFGGGRDVGGSFNLSFKLIQQSYTILDIFEKYNIKYRYGRAPVFRISRVKSSDIRASVKAIADEHIKRLDLEDDFEIQDKVIVNKVTGVRIESYGLNAEAQKSKVEDVKSAQGVVRWLIDEAQLLNLEVAESISQTLRQEGSQIWLRSNQIAKELPFQIAFKNRTDYKHLHLTYHDNMFLTDLSRNEIEQTKATNYPKYLKTYLGIWDAVNDTRVISSFTNQHILKPFKPNPKEVDSPIVISCDFNALPMCWGIAQPFYNTLLFFDEQVCSKTTTTEKAAKQLLNKLITEYQLKPDQKIVLTGDTSGLSINTKNDRNDYDLMENILSSYFNGVGKQTRLKNNYNNYIERKVSRKHMSVQDRCKFANLMFDKKRILITENCEHIIHSLQMTEYKDYSTGTRKKFTMDQCKGDPKKQSCEHIFDAVTYGIWYHLINEFKDQLTYKVY